MRDKHSNGAKGAKQSLETRREAPLPALALAAGMKQKRGMHIADKKKHEPFPRDPRGGQNHKMKKQKQGPRQWRVGVLVWGVLRH